MPMPEKNVLCSGGGTETMLSTVGRPVDDDTSGSEDIAPSEVR
jgi:hypothetical protein